MENICAIWVMCGTVNFKLKPNNTVLGIHAHVTWSYYFCCCYLFLLNSTKQYTLVYLALFRLLYNIHTTYLNQYWWKCH